MKNSVNFENFKKRYTSTTSLWDWLVSQLSKWPLNLKCFPSIVQTGENSTKTTTSQHLSSNNYELNNVLSESTKHNKLSKEKSRVIAFKCMECDFQSFGSDSHNILTHYIDSHYKMDVIF